MTARAAAVLAVLGALSACSPAPYARLAQAGKDYSSSIAGLSTAAGTLFVDATSEQMAVDRMKLSSGPGQCKGAARKSPPNGKETDAHQAETKNNEDRLDILSAWSRHAELMGEYYDALAALAAPDAAKATETSADGLASGLADAGNVVRKTSWLTGSSLSSGVNLVIGAATSAALKRQFNAHKDTLKTELATEQSMLERLADYAAHDLKTVRQIRLERTVDCAWAATAPIPDADAWVTARRTVLTYDPVGDKLDAASQALRKLLRAFGELH